MAGTFQISVPGVARLRPRVDCRATNRRFADRPTPAARTPSPEGTPVLRLVGVALLGWFGLMSVVALLAVY
jgi:hypothetical protein